MDSAHLGDLISIAAVNIAIIKDWKKQNWFCLGCSVRVVPVACNPDKKFDKVAHFRLKEAHGKHSNNCGIAGLSRLINKARRRPIEANDKLLGNLPYSVVFRDSVTTISEPRVNPNGPLLGSGFLADPVTSEQTIFHRPSCTKIESICCAHAALRNEKLRETLSLKVEDCLGTNYRDTFYQLQDIQQSSDPPKLFGCIFYGELRFRGKPNYDDSGQLILTLNRGTCDGRRYRLIIRWQKWSEQLQALFVKEVEAKRLAANKRWDSRDKGTPFRSDILVYFLGNQVDGSPTDFEVSDFRKVAIIVEPNGLYKDYPHHSFLRKTPPVEEAVEESEPRSGVTSSEFTVPPPPPEPQKSNPLAAPRLPVTRGEQVARPATPISRLTPTLENNNRQVSSVDRTPFISPSYYLPQPKPRTGVIEIAKEWLFSWFR